MKTTLLGSGGWEGIPAPFCLCRVCAKAAQDPFGKEARTRPGLLIETAEGAFMLEVGPDIRVQSTRFGLPPIKHFFVSHWHFDHLYGLLELHAWSRFVMGGDISIYGSKNTLDWMEKSFAHIPKKAVLIRPFEPVILFGVRVTPFPVHHMWNQDHENETVASNNTFGFLLEHGGKRIAYLSDYYELPEKSLQLISGVDVLVADGTYILEELFPNKKLQLGEKSDSDHIHGKAIIETLSSIKAKQVVFHSITHLSERFHDEIASSLPPNWVPGFDGMVL